MNNNEYYQIADELRGIANLGLHFTKNEHDREHFARVLALSARLVASLEQRAPDEVLTQYRDNLGHFSPIVGVEAVVWRDGKLLLIRRADDGLWALPGGLVEVGENAVESAARELWEEAGMRGRVTQLLGIFDSRLWRTRTRMQLYGIIFSIESEDIPVAGPEALGAHFFAENELPPLSQGHDLRVPFVFKQARGQAPIPYFDPVEENNV